MRKKCKLLVLICSIMLLVTACSFGSVDLEEQLSLGNKYLVAGDYEKAIVAFTKVIQVDAKNVEANRMIADAYQKMNQPDEAAEAMLNVVLLSEYTEEDIQSLTELLDSLADKQQGAVLAQMAYAKTCDERFVSFLFKIKGEKKDFEGIRRLVQEVSMVNGMKERYLQEMLQVFYENHDYDSMGQVAEILTENDVGAGISLVLSLLQVYGEKGEDGVIEYLENYYDNGENLPSIDEDSEVYIGGYDENGMRSGFGICFYGKNVKTTSRIYVGNWKQGLRSGDGRAYRKADYRIQCSWEQDYPVGEVTILQRTITVLGTLSMGHVATPMNLYEWNEWMAVHCTPDSSKSRGYSYQTKYMRSPGNCGHVAKHSYCWDCMVQEQENGEEIDR